MGEKSAMATHLDPVDVDSIYRAHVRPLYAFIYSRVGNREAAEDLTSDVFVKALGHLDTGRQEASIAAWLYRVARNAVTDYWRAAGRAQVIALDDARLARTTPSAPDVPRQEQNEARARAVLDRLPENYRRVLSFRLLEGLSVAEAASAMGTSEANVKVLQHRALKRAAELREEEIGGR